MSNNTIYILYGVSVFIYLSSIYLRVFRGRKKMKKEVTRIYSWEDMKKEWKERDNAKGLKKIWYNIEDRYYWCCGRVDDLRDIPYRIKAFWQRGKRGWADRDTWCLGSYIARVISESVLHLKNTNTGYPGNLTKEKWDKILKDISRGFALLEKEANGEKGSVRGLPKKTKEKLRKEFDCLSEEDEKTITEAWKLLRKWLTGLWD